ncbi:PREDICTED: epithelial discoidin domain-containing receptor 1-like [Nicrophorus vespilloides]|uniref:Epithelial discoidin domain-containing receptor 1-like n=1 Tax=Nicrophorus vespilloides TaxID=110193 RepID=A0ABM1M6X5_NICVS|nr:PREDICTED: epithelial discoidin domain-containing receptor 1-like [Nicrophorus vespilloides]XP_017770326.1 PREDICTED: epithelial discoidin domain-containing receptor 1-like [Nicrophorus vespilloides]
MHFTIVPLLALFLRVAHAVDPSQCIAPLGMENGAIRDDDISASSSFENGNVGPQHGRVRTERNGGAWCPQKQATTEPEEWLQIDLKTAHVITSVGTQGRFGNGQGVEFAEAYMLEYWRPRLNKWIKYHNYKGEEVIKANTNTYLEAKKTLDPPIWASKIRFYPYSYHQRTVCMRVELYGCKWTDGIVSYSMPQGDKRGSNWEFYDFGYDGHWDGHDLKYGLGQLIDGKFGQDNFKLDFYDDLQTWVGWKNDSRSNRPIEITFEFDRIREFSAVHIYSNNLFTKDVQVFSMAKVLFSIGGKVFTKGEPISYEYIEDKIFENSRNVSIKLHHRIGKFAKLQLYFSAKWLLISEITFDSIVAHGNFTVESEPTDAPKGDFDKNNREHKIEIPIHQHTLQDATYLTIIIITLIILILLCAVAIPMIINRFRSRKFLQSPNAPNMGFPANTLPRLQPESIFGGMSEKVSAIEAYGVTEIDDCRSHGTLKSSLRSTLPLPQIGHKMCDTIEYQEPYQAKYAPYYSYSSVVMEMQNTLSTKRNYASTTPVDVYDYAIPEGGTLPLLVTEPSQCNKDNDINTKARSSYNRSPTEQEAINALRKRFEEVVLPEFPRHRLRMLSKLSEGAFGTVYIAQADGIVDHSSNLSLGTKLVAIKFLGDTSTQKEKNEFYRDVRILSALDDANIAKVLGVCSEEDPLCVVMEYLEHGDLCQFLKTHIAAESNCTVPHGVKSLSPNCLLYMGAQIASGMRYLESLNFVHRDLATRNCLVGKAYQIKICDFGTYNEVYYNDYYKVDGNVPLPIRWMAWESVYQSKYTTKSDVWAFAVTLWEILTLCRRQPFNDFSDPLVMENLAHMHCDDGQFTYLPRPLTNKDIYDLMLECWKRKDSERPSFREIHLFLQRKNLGYAPT